jgi:hypothetical protein
MSALNDLDAMVLRQEVYPPMTTKNAELTFTEWDDRVIDIYRAIQDVVNGDNVDAYNPATTYDGTSSDVYLKFVGYNSRIWQAVFAGTFSGETPAEGIYWTQVTLAQMLPNVLKLAEIGSGASQSVKFHTEIIAPAAVLTGNTTPIILSIPRQAGQSIGIVATPVFSLSYGTTAYTTNTIVELGYDGSDVPMYTCDILGRTATGVKNGVIITSVGNAQSQILSDCDLVYKVQTGDPLAGDSYVTVSVIYIII